MTQSSSTYISVVLSTWNNAEELIKTLEAFVDGVEFEEASWEIIVVNNNSTDHTAEVLEEFEDVLPLVIVFEARQGLSYGRNAGIRAANGRWIIFVDDDIRPTKSWSRDYLRAFDSYPDGHFFGGPLESRFVGEPPPPELLPFATGAIRGFVLREYAETSTTHRTFAGANWAVSKEALDSVGEFDPELGISAGREMRFGEETDIQDRLVESGLQPVYVPGAVLLHTVPAHKCEAEYIVGRAEALAFNKALLEPRSIGRVAKLLLSTVAYYALHQAFQAAGIAHHLMHYRWRVRRGRLRGLLQKSR